MAINYDNNIFLGIIFLVIAFIIFIVYSVIGEHHRDEPPLLFLASPALLIVSIILFFRYNLFIALLGGLVSLLLIALSWWIIFTPAVVISSNDYVGSPGITITEIGRNTPGEVKVTLRNGREVKILGVIDPEETNKHVIPAKSTVFVTSFDGVVAKLSPYIPVRLKTEKKLFPNPFANLQKRIKSKIINATKIGDCVVCKLPISKTQHYLELPCCGALAHKNHILEWLNIRGTCPHCKTRIKWNGKSIVLMTDDVVVPLSPEKHDLKKKE